MPPPLDLTARRFGRLVVLSRGPRVKFGRWQSSWLCCCDCGAVITVPQNRLPHRASIPVAHRIDACDDCRAHPCVICGQLIPPRSTAATCSPDCLAEHKRRYHLDWYHARFATDFEFRIAQSYRSAERYRRLSAEERRALNRSKYQRELTELGRDEINARARAGHAARMQDPDYREKRRAKSLDWNRNHPEKARKASRDSHSRRRADRAAREIGRIIEENEE